ncbi:Mediator of RNA polymerase II transcription subunit 31 [Elasticomyces elasticus]|nr:Mediator of RNA polymerase II transcription subunit 31 [Elasticomyces elasticus]
MNTTIALENPPSPPSPRFTLELEFVLALSSPQYLQHLGVNFPHLLNPSASSTSNNIATNRASSTIDDNSPHACFVRYLKYLWDYWKTPEYSQFLTHPAAVLRNLELLQNEQFRRDLTRPDLAAALGEGFGLPQEEKDKPTQESTVLNPEPAMVNGVI